MTRLARLWWLAPLLFAAALAARDTGADAGDVVFFAHAGENLFAHGWTAVYADPTLQSGPLQLVVLGGLAKLAAAVGVSLGAMLAPAIEVGGAAALLLVLRRLVGDRVRHREPVLLAAGIAAVALGLPQSAWLDGHPAQLAVPLLWLVAALDARAGRTTRAGVLVGLSAGLEVWGLLGVCVLAAAPRLRDAARSAAWAGAAFAVPLAPFVLVGNFRMFDFSWTVAPDTLVSLVVAPGTEYPWPLRLVQAAAALGGGALVARRLRGSLSGVWLAPLAAVCIRFCFDPVFYASYWLAPLSLLLVGAVDTCTGGLVRRALVERRSGQGAAAIRR